MNLQTDFDKLWIQFKKSTEFHKCSKKMFEKGILYPDSEFILRAAFDAAWDIKKKA